MNIFLVFSIFLILLVVLAFIIQSTSLDSYENVEEFYNAPSQIAGTGIFNRQHVYKDQKLFKGIASDRRVTRSASKLNHCWSPNTALRYNGDDKSWWLYAMRDIAAHSELTTDYRYTPSFIRKPDPKWTC